MLLRFNIEDMRRAGMECLIGTDKDGQTATISIRALGSPINFIQTDVLWDVAIDCGYNPDEIEAFIDEHEGLMHEKLLVRAVFNAAKRSAIEHKTGKEDNRERTKKKVKVYNKKEFDDVH